MNWDNFLLLAALKLKARHSRLEVHRVDMLLIDGGLFNGIVLR